MNPKAKPHNLPERLRELPMVVYKDLYQHLLSTGVSRMTALNVLKGKSRNLPTLVAMANYLYCDVKDIFDPNYHFQDPRKNPKHQEKIASELGLTKSRKS